jgi:hypothetical protein
MERAQYAGQIRHHIVIGGDRQEVYVGPTFRINWSESMQGM